MASVCIAGEVAAAHMFTDRAEAGRYLAKKLEHYRGEDAVVLALPRGGVAIGYEVSKALVLPLDIASVRKIGHPLSPEYAVGAVDENGTVILNETEAVALDKIWLKEETARQQAEAKRRSRLYRAGRAHLPVAARAVIIVDDGAATGLTMRLAVKSAMSRKARKVIVAVPVASSESLQAFAKEGVSDTIALDPPENFRGAVGAHYERFDQVEDEEVIRLLKDAWKER